MKLTKERSESKYMWLVKDEHGYIQKVFNKEDEADKYISSLTKKQKETLGSKSESTDRKGFYG